MRFEDYLRKTQKIFINPTAFFKSVAHEKGYVPILMYFGVAWIIVGIIGILGELPRIIQAGGMGQILGVLFQMIVMIISAFAIPFIGAGMDHIGVLLCGGKQGFFPTFKASNYAAIVAIVYQLGGTIAGMILNVINPIEVSGLQNGVSLSGMLLAMLPQIIIGGIIFLIGMIHSMYIEVIGISLYQKMSKGKAVVAVVVIPFAMLFVFLIATTVIAVAIGSFVVAKFIGS